MPEKQEKNIHQFHRQRVRARFIKEGLDNFEPHNILELLLFYSIPRKDTNVIAHRLMDRYKTLHAVFEADYEDLIKIDGMSQASATLIKLIPAVSKRYLLDKYDEHMKFNGFEQIGRYLVDYFCKETDEKTVAVFLNNSLELIDCVKISDGTPSSTEVPFRKIAEHGMLKNAVTFILAHNHPGGTTAPSYEDEQTTLLLAKTFKSIGLPLLDHIIVAGNEYRCILHDVSSSSNKPKRL